MFEFLLRRGGRNNYKALLSKNANIDTKNKQVCTALIISSDYGHLDIAHLLVEKNAKVDIQDEDGDTALICSCRRGRKDGELRALLERHRWS
jgi:ankyrin repeat protein